MLSFYNEFGKRFIDIVLVCLIFFFACWLILIITLAYVASFKYPIIYKARRIGLHGNAFQMIKFRTLSNDESVHLANRIFSLGKFLRFTNLDELPQLWNVLKGEMSITGPRPLPIEYFPLMSDVQKKRHSVLPGITGWAQVSGKNDISWQQKFELDLFYLNHLSFKLDIRILVKTIVLLFTFRKDTSLSEEKFTG
jgi:undecaprenyl phosphate N,N'-diacetylbacillosamine 1-phosphate transferase